jgi:poly-gamma-glutamate capsule biosynthesis protein CapA/YwtB (metallophosphatase superfamily)
MPIGLLGDVMLGRGVADVLASTPGEELWSPEVRELASACDFVILNLECCVSEGGARTHAIPGKPFFFRAPPQAVGALRAIGTSAVSLANNHALDYGPDALLDTVKHLEQADIPATGAGPDAPTARTGCILETSALRLGIIAVSDHPVEYAAGADAARPGIAYADLSAGAPAWLLDELERLRSSCDRVLFFPHWGPNMTTAPARWQRRLAADLVAAGTDLIAGHSAHVFHGVERRGSALIAYDLGDALDDYAVDRKLRNDLGLMALWSPGVEPGPGRQRGADAQPDELELVGLRLHYARTDLVYGDDADWMASRLESACAKLGTGLERVAEQRFRVV